MSELPLDTNHYSISKGLILPTMDMLSPPNRECFNTPKQNRLVRNCFIALTIVGISTHWLVCFTTLSLAHPDEHQQYLEQAFRAIHGHGITFWEQDTGIRHWLYPGLLAILLGIEEATGISNPFLQRALIQSFVAVLILLVNVRFAWEFHQRGRTPTALWMLVCCTLFPDLIYLQTRLLTESAVIIPLLLTIVWLRPYPLFAGLIFGLSFGIRFHAGFFIATLTFLAWWSNRGHKPFRLGGRFPLFIFGLGVSLLGMGVIDWCTHGTMFHSPWEYFYANLIEGKANEFGIEPWYQYFIWMADWSWPVLIAVALFILPGAIREWKLSILILVFGGVHLLVQHKEGRFLWPLSPLVVALSGTSFGMIYERLSFRWRIVLVSVFVLGFGTLGVYRLCTLPWHDEAYHGSADLLHQAGKDSRFHGVVLFGRVYESTGNYFFLQNNIPYFAVGYEDKELLEDWSLWKNGEIDALITTPDSIDMFLDMNPEPVSTSGPYTL